MGESFTNTSFGEISYGIVIPVWGILKITDGSASDVPIVICMVCGCIGMTFFQT